jgi:nucleoside-diphosphate-sugar epimerase
LTINIYVQKIMEFACSEFTSQNLLITSENGVRMTVNVAFVTGATGFIGSALVEKLVANHTRVKCLVRSTSRRRWLATLPIEFIDGDLFSREALSHALSDVTHIFHLAGLTKAIRREDYFRANCGGTKSLLELASRSCERLERFVYVSSQAAAGPSLNGNAVTEADNPHPVSIYGKSKLAGERACQAMGKKLPWTIIRPPAVYGPRERDIYTYFQQVNLGVRLLLGSVERWVSIVYVDDLANGILAASQHPKSVGETYFIANAEPCEWSNLGEIIAKALGRKTIRVTLPTWLAPVLATSGEAISMLTRKPPLLGFDKIRELKQPGWVCSSDKISTQLGFQCEISLEEGMSRTAAWYREQGWL